MKAIVLEEPGTLSLQDQAAPTDPGRDEALVQVRRVGICGTDLHAFGGNQNFFSYPRIMGHELAVDVLSIGATVGDLDYSVGDTCCVIPYLNCGNCIACRRGKSNCCAQMQVLGVHIDGGMREQFTLPADKLLKADGVPLGAAVKGDRGQRRLAIEENVVVQCGILYAELAFPSYQEGQGASDNVAGHGDFIPVLG